MSSDVLRCPFGKGGPMSSNRATICVNCYRTNVLQFMGTLIRD